jgi:hypothetical protein
MVKVPTGAAVGGTFVGAAVGGTAVAGTAVAGATVVAAGPHAARRILMTTMSENKDTDFFIFFFSF